MAEEVEVVLHQVRVSVPAAAIPESAPDRKEFSERLVTLAEIWARQCINERHSEIADL